MSSFSHAVKYFFTIAASNDSITIDKQGIFGKGLDQSMTFSPVGAHLRVRPVLAEGNTTADFAERADTQVGPYTRGRRRAAALLLRCREDKRFDDDGHGPGGFDQGADVNVVEIAERDTVDGDNRAF